MRDSRAVRTAGPTAVAHIGLALALATAGCGRATDTAGSAPAFESVQPETFGAAGAQPNAWADFDGDGDIDLFVGFRGRADRLYRNDDGTFTDVAAAVGLGDEEETRVAAWGDYDGDGWPDLYIGFANTDKRNRLYRNEQGTRFTDVAPDLGVDLTGTTRQVSWIDFDGDGDTDLFIAFRDQPNRLFRNDAGGFTDVTETSGIGDPRKTVGVVWFDLDRDGDLDAFVANQDGDMDGVFRNDGGRFIDVAPELDMARPGRAADQGGVGPSVADYDNDGDFDLFVATYGPNLLYRNEGDGRFTLAMAEAGLAADYHATPSVWGDYDNDGWIDLYVGSYMRDDPEARDYLYRNDGGVFRDVTPAIVLEHGASHGAQWMDFDGDGDLDLALANNHPDAGRHPLYRNLLPAPLAGRSLQVMVRTAAGRYTVPGAEVAVYRAGTDRLIGVRLVDTGGGYCSQNAAPVHIGLGAESGLVDVEVTVPRAGRRETVRIDGVDAAALRGRALEIRVPPPG